MENQEQTSLSPRKKLKSPLLVGSLNTKTSVTCSNVPESLFDAANAKKHFTKFGRIQKIRLFPKRHMCIIEYDQPLSAERAVLNAGAYDGFMFEVTRTKPRVRRKSKREDDPDWVPDSDVEEELSAMGGAPVYRVTRQKPMDVEIRVNTLNKGLSRVIKQSPMKRKPVTERKTIIPKQQSGIESPVLVAVTQTSMSTIEAALELHLLRSKVSMTSDEQWRTLDARDKILRSWGGAGARVKVGGATIGTCRDMCPEKERLHRQAEHQVMTLETVPESDGQLDARRAVKQYSRSSADQEMPMCYELRPAPVLMRTCAYLLKEVADTTRQISLADWFHFMWDRFRGIRKDITQQALCCADSIKLVEMCARFHAHCAARLADLEHTQFDQKLNTDNLTKCLQTLKHMYTDAKPELKPREAEFRGYIALLNLGDANFWWEIKQLPGELQKSEAITFAIKIFNALDNNNYVRFFRLIKEKASYLQACILMRYFNDVRARALARIVKAYAPRGGSRFPVEDLMNALSFESVDNMKSFISHYGLRISKMDDYEPTIILDRNQFIEDSDPYPLSRSIELIESKRWNTVGEVIAGGQLPGENFESNLIHSSFNKDGTLKETALIAEDQDYNTINDSNKDISVLKAELQKHSCGEKKSDIIERFTESPKDVRILSDIGPEKIKSDSNKLFSFKPAIRIASNDAIKMSKENEFKEETKKVFSFSRPHESVAPSLFSSNLGSKTDSSLFKEINNKNKDLLKPTQSVFNNNANNTDANLFKKPEVSKYIFNQTSNVHKTEELNKNIFNVSREQKDQQIKPSTFHSTSIFRKAKDEPDVGSSDNVFGKSANIFAKATEEFDTKKSANIFAKAMSSKGETSNSVIFGNFSTAGAVTNASALVPSRTISENVNNENVRSLFASTVASRNQLSPSSLFKSAVSQANGPAFNTLPVSNNLFNPANSAQPDVYDFNENNDEAEKQIALRNYNEEKLRLEELKRQEELKRIELKRQEEERQNEEARKKQEELKRIEEKRRIEEEKKKEALRKKFKEEEERKAELKRKAEEDARKLKERIDKESAELVEELVNEINKETVLENTNKELNKFRSLVSLAGVATENLLIEITMEICHSELKSEKLWAEKLMKKYFSLWRKQYLRNVKRRNLLDDVPVWISGATPFETARTLRRVIENDALKNMNAIHKGYKFTGEPRQVPYPEPYNIVEIIKTPLLKRIRQIHYPYDKCFFWKVTLVSPGRAKWLLKKIDIEKWLFDVFGDGKAHDISDSLLRVEKQSWNDLMDFAISISITDSKERLKNCSEATEGANCMLFYATENDTKLLETIDEILKHKYPYQVIPIAVIVPETYTNTLEPFLSTLVKQGIISAFKIFIIDSVNVFDSLNASTKRALKWMSKKYPISPPLEVDFLKSVCQRYLGNEIWCMLKSERDNRMSIVLKDFKKLVQCYNMAVTQLTHVITNEDLFNYPLFPLEFKKYLDETSPYPKPYEFIPSSAKNSGNLSTIKDIMMQLELPIPASGFNPKNVITMQEQIRKYCNQIGWLAQNSENVVCKVVAVLPTELTDYEVSSEEFNKCLENYDLIDLLNIIVYEKISRLSFHNVYAIYRKSDLENYRNNDWMLYSDVMSSVKQRPYERADELDMFIECKRRKLALDTMECLMLEEKDCTLVEENIKVNEEKITKYNQYEDEVKRLEQQIEEERKRSINLDNLLRAALSDV